MYGSILNQVEPSVNLYSQTTQPSSYYGIWTTTLGVNQVTFVKDLESSTISGYNSNVMIIKQLDNKNKYKTKLIRTMQIDENSNLYFSGCTINNGQANQIYYGTGYSWVLVNNEYTPPSGGSGGLSYNLFAQATEPDTYDGVWTTNTEVTSVEVIDGSLSEIIPKDMFTVTHMFGQEFIIVGDLLYMISGCYSSNSVVTANGLGTGYIWVYSMITKKLIKTIPIPGCTGLYMHSCVLYNNKIYIIGGRTKFDTTSISDKIYIFDIASEQFDVRTITSKFYGNNCVIYKDIIYIICGFVDSTSNLSSSIFRYNILSQTLTSESNTSRKRFLSGCVHFDDCVYIISGFETNITNPPTNTTYKYELLTNTWKFVSYSDHVSLCRNGHKYVDGKLYSISYNYVGGVGVSSMNYIESNLINGYSRATDSNFSGTDFMNASGAGACVIYNNSLFCIGGYSSTVRSGVYEFNMNSFLYTIKSPLTTARRLFGYCIRNDDIYIFGGSTSSTTFTGSSVALKYNITSDSYTTLTSLPAARVGRGCVLVGDFIYLFGGAVGSSVNEYTTGCTYYSTCHKYDIVNNTYTAIADLPTTTAEMMCYKVNDNEILIIGGFTTGSTKSTQVLIYNITTNLYTTLTSVPTAIAGQADSSCVKDTRIYIASNTGYMKDTERIDHTIVLSSYGSYYTQRSFVYNDILYIASPGESLNIIKLKLSKYKSKISPEIGGLDSSLLMYNNKPYINFNFGDVDTAQSSCVGRLYEINDGNDSYTTYFNFKFRKSCSYSCIYNDKLYVYAEQSGGIGMSQFHEYNLISENNDPKIASMINSPVNCSAVLRNGYIYILGGYARTSSTEDNFNGRVYRTTIPAGSSISNAVILKYLDFTSEVKRKNHTSVLYGNSMYSVGGFILKDKSLATNTLIKVNLDDFDNDIVSLTSLENCPKDIVDADSVCVGDKMYVVFGYHKSIESFNTDILVYDITNNTWSVDLATTINLRNHKILLRDNQIYIFGGEDASGSVDTVYKYNITNKEVTLYGKLPNKISRFGLSYWAGQDKAVLSGGYNTYTTTEYSDIFYYDFKVRDIINNSNTNTLYLGSLGIDDVHYTKLITDNNMKIPFTDVFINSEEPYDVYKGDSTQWIKIK